MTEGQSETAQPDTSQRRSQSGSLLVTFIGGALLGASAMWTGLELQGTPQGMSMPAQQGGMAHETKAANIVAVDNWAARPTLDTAVYRDPGAGWNLNVITTNFTFDAQSAGLENVATFSSPADWASKVKLVVMTLRFQPAPGSR